MQFPVMFFMQFPVIYRLVDTHVVKGYACTFREDNYVKLFLRSFWKGISSKRNEFAPILGANSFLLE